MTDRTFYDVLNVPRRAKPEEIDRAYARVRAELRKASAAPNPRLTAMAKVAYETLSNPTRRAEYDRSLVEPVDKAADAVEEADAPRGRRLPLMAIVAVLVVAGSGAAAYFYWAQPRTASPAAAAPGGLDTTSLAQEVGPHVARLKSAHMSGEVRDLGMAVALGEQMVTTCQGVSASSALSVSAGGSSRSASLTREDRERDVCTVAAKGFSSELKTRASTPAPKEKLAAVLIGATGEAIARPVDVVRMLEDPKGPAFAVKAGIELPNGTPLFDAQLRLVGLVTSPHGFGDGVVAAIGAGRIAQPAPSVAAAPPASSPSPSAPTPSAPTPSAPTPSAPATSSPSRGAELVAEGFTTLWIEDDYRLVELRDNVKTGEVGNPLAYWTQWRGLDSSRVLNTACRVTYGDQLVTEYEQAPRRHASDGYLFCAITRFQVELERIPEGEYTFEIFVDGKSAATNSIMVKKRFFNTGMLMILVVIVGLVALIYAQKLRKP